MGQKIFDTMCNITQNKDIFYLAYGKLTQNILHSIVETTRKGVYDYYANKEYSSRDMDNLIVTVIEMVQNVSKYKQETDHYSNDVILITTNDNITVSTSNLIKKTNKDKISKSIDCLNSLDSKELRKYARETIKKNRVNDDNSAGLGLIEIARLSKKDIEYNFKTYSQNDELAHFNITINL